MENSGWNVEGLAEQVDRDRLKSLYFSNQLTGKLIHPVGEEIALTHQQLMQIVGDIAPPPQLGYTQPPAANYQVSPTEDPLRFVVPVNPSMWALAAGYLGLFSVLCLPGPFSLFAGIMGLRDIKNNPSKNGIGRAWFGVIMGSIGTLVMIIFGVLAILEKK